jgi:hypothetical protein
MKIYTNKYAQFQIFNLNSFFGIWCLSGSMCSRGTELHAELQPPLTSINNVKLHFFVDIGASQRVVCLAYQPHDSHPRYVRRWPSSLKCSFFFGKVSYLHDIVWSLSSLYVSLNVFLPLSRNSCASLPDTNILFQLCCDRISLGASRWVSTTHCEASVTLPLVILMPCYMRCKRMSKRKEWLHRSRVLLKIKIREFGGDGEAGGWARRNQIDAEGAPVSRINRWWAQYGEIGV